MSIENSQAILKYFIDLKSETSVNQTRLEIYKAFQDRLTILNRLIAEIYWKYRTAGHVVFWKRSY